MEDSNVVIGPNVPFLTASSLGSDITLGHEFQLAIQKVIKEYLKNNLEIDVAIQKVIKEYLKNNLEIDVIRWKDTECSITVQVSLDNKVLSEKTL